MSPYLFILAAEIMSHEIRNNNEIKGLQYLDKEIKLMSYADDTTVFLKSKDDAASLFSYLQNFERVSGLKINKEKTEGLWLGTQKSSSSKPFGIKWPLILKVLGIYIGHDTDLMLARNFKDKVI